MSVRSRTLKHLERVAPGIYSRISPRGWRIMGRALDRWNRSALLRPHMMWSHGMIRRMDTPTPSAPEVGR